MKQEGYEMLKIGDRVRKKSQTGDSGEICGGPFQSPGGETWKVKTLDGNPTNWLTKFIELIPQNEDVQTAVETMKFGNHTDFSQYITFQRLSAPLRDNIYSMDATKTKFYPHQFKPLLKFLESHTQKLLIADEVGLGKTVEAGLILTEMRARVGLESVLVHRIS
jgi:hypothetical protein